MAKCSHAGEKKPHCNETNKRYYHLKLPHFSVCLVPECNFCSPAWQFWTSWMQGRSLFFSNGGHYRECQRTVPFGRVWGYAPPEKFQIWRPQNAIFSTCHELVSNRPQISVKRQAFSVLALYFTSVYFWGSVNLEHTIYPNTIAYTKHFK